MPFTKITDDDRAGKGTVGMADTPNLTAAEMQVKFDELANLTITKFNNHVDEEGSISAAANTGAVDPTTNGTAINIQGVLDNLHNKKQEKETGKGLSANDFTDTYKSKLETSFTNTHTHTNKSVLDTISSAVKTAYDNLVSIFTGISSVTTTVNGSDTAVPTAGAISRYVQQMGGGDMVKSIYDTDNDGKVDHAEVADSLQNPIAATAVTYDHTESGMTAVNAQAAIDEVHGEAKNSVQKSAIENDLLGTDVEKVLAAPQGKALDDKITAINSNMNSLSFAQDGSGKWGYKVAGADPVIPFSKGLELLWTNPSPSSAFAAQTVLLNLSKYKYIAIDSIYSYAFASTNNYRSICIQPVPSQTSGTGISKIIVAFDNQGSGSNRDTTISTTGITFSSGKRLLSGQVFDDSAGYCVPLRIYGIADIT